jgi:hypothetical protein
MVSALAVGTEGRKSGEAQQNPRVSAFPFIRRSSLRSDLFEGLSCEATGDMLCRDGRGKGRYVKMEVTTVATDVKEVALVELRFLLEPSSYGIGTSDVHCGQKDISSTPELCVICKGDAEMEAAMLVVSR